MYVLWFWGATTYWSLLILPLFFVPEIGFPGSYRHTNCCYLCEAITHHPDYPDGHPNLYTHWGRDAAYREFRSCFIYTACGKFDVRWNMIHAPSHVEFTTSYIYTQMQYNAPMAPRLTSTATFLEINGVSPLCRIRGFSCWRFFSEFVWSLEDGSPLQIGF